MAGALIVTAELGKQDFAWLDALRRRHYPAERNRVPAHLTLFRTLPPSAEAEVRRAMAETTVIIEGGSTNKSFVLDLLDQPEVIDGSADTGWIDRVRAAAAPGRLHPARDGGAGDGLLHAPHPLRGRGHRGGRGGRQPRDR